MRWGEEGGEGGGERRSSPVNRIYFAVQTFSEDGTVVKLSTTLNSSQR